MTQQLDIIVDTDLRADYLASGKDSASSSIAIARASARAGQCFVKRGVSRAKDSASSSVDARVAKINRARISAGMSHEELCRLARAGSRNWFRILRGEQTASNELLNRLEAALATPRLTKPPQIVAAFHRLVMQFLAMHLRFDIPTLLATDFSVQRPFNPQWLAAARIRQMAIYITAVELQVSNADLGRALGDSRANIKYARDQVEERREDGNEVDQALSAVLLQVQA